MHLTFRRSRWFHCHPKTLSIHWCPSSPMYLTSQTTRSFHQLQSFLLRRKCHSFQTTQTFQKLQSIPTSRFHQYLPMSPSLPSIHCFQSLPKSPLPPHQSFPMSLTLQTHQTILKCPTFR